MVTAPFKFRPQAGGWLGDRLIPPDTVAAPLPLNVTVLDEEKDSQKSGCASFNSPPSVAPQLGADAGTKEIPPSS